MVAAEWPLVDRAGALDATARVLDLSSTWKSVASPDARTYSPLTHD